MTNSKDLRSGHREKSLKVSNCKLCEYPLFSHERGFLVPIEFNTNFPFLPKRSFIVSSVNSETTRGKHAHKICKQFLFEVSGSLTVLIDDGINKEEIVLKESNFGLLINEMVWAEQYRFSREGTLLVFASEAYDVNDYITSYDNFLSSINV